MRRGIPQCGIASFNLWTSGQVEALIFFREPTGNPESKLNRLCTLVPSMEGREVACVPSVAESGSS